MKIVVFSDSHGDAETMCSVVENEKPDMIIFLGDGIADAEQLSEKNPEIKMIKVLGGVDFDNEDEEWIKFAEICGKRFVIAHGHMFIRYTFDSELKKYRQTDDDRIQTRIDMLKIMIDNDADILLHGHTHEPYINRMQLTPDKTGWIMNPGSIRRKGNGTFSPVYGVINLNESGALEWRFVEIGGA